MTKVIVLLAEGFEEVEALTPVDYLRRMGVEVDMVALTENLIVEGAHGIKIIANKQIDEILDYDNYNGVIIPGGLPGAANLRDDDRVIKLVKEFNEKKRLVAAICAGPIVLARAGIIKGKYVTSYPGFEKDLQDGKYKEDIVVQDGNIITARGPAIAVYFAIRISEYLQGAEKAEELKKSILLDLV